MNTGMPYGESSRTYYVYIMANELVTVLYIGVTGYLLERVYEHRIGAKEGFTKRYNLKKLVYFEETDDISAALYREKQLKNWRHSWKMELIRTMNPTLKDLTEGWYENETEDDGDAGSGPA